MLWAFVSRVEGVRITCRGRLSHVSRAFVSLVEGVCLTCRGRLSHVSWALALNYKH